jgi:hypothetical protein
MSGHADIPVGPLRDAFLRSGVSASELARRLGWTRPDSLRVHRQLGVTIDRNGHGSPVRHRETMSTARAYEILDALGIDPLDVEGL